MVRVACGVVEVAENKLPRERFRQSAADVADPEVAAEADRAALSAARFATRYQLRVAAESSTECVVDFHELHGLRPQAAGIRVEPTIERLSLIHISEPTRPY